MCASNGLLKVVTNMIRVKQEFPFSFILSALYEDEVSSYIGRLGVSEACLVEIAIWKLYADGIVLIFESLERPQRYHDSIKSFCTENDLFDKP